MQTKEVCLISLANSNPHEVLVLVCGRDYAGPCIELYIMSTDYL